MMEMDLHSLWFSSAFSYCSGVRYRLLQGVGACCGQCAMLSPSIGHVWGTGGKQFPFGHVAKLVHFRPLFVTLLAIERCFQ